MGADCNAFSSVGWSILDFAPFRGGQVVGDDDALTLSKLFIANGANPRSRNADSKETPALFSPHPKKLRKFLGFAEKWIKKLKLYWTEKAAREEKLLAELAETSSKRREKIPAPEREVLKLERELLPHLLTPERRRAIRNDIYRHGLRFEKMQPWLDAVYTAALSLKASCQSITGNEFPALVLVKVLEFSKPDIKDFDCRKDTVEDEDPSDVDVWGKPEDACSENGFLGGYNAVANEGDVHPKDEPPNCVCS